MPFVNTVMYGYVMTRRLSRQDWIEYGLTILSEKGFNALKAEPLARGLKVSRGSFYWHFKHLRAFQEAVLEHWKTTTTERVIDQVASDAEALKALTTQALTSNPTLERSIRAWSSEVAWVAQVVDSVDRRRIQFIEQLLEEQRVPNETIPVRAKVLYWAYLGRVLVNSSELDDRAVDDIVKLMLKP